MASGCKSSLCAIDARVPVRATYVNLYKWPESDAEFLKSVAAGKRTVGHQRSHSHHETHVHGSNSKTSNLDEKKKHYQHNYCNPSPHIVDSYSCRQMFLRSYTFTKEESVHEKTMKCLGTWKDKAADIPFINHRSKGNSDCSSNSSSNVHDHSTTQRKKNKHVKKRSKNKKKGCSFTVKRLREMSRSALDFVFHRLLSCTSSVDVVD